MEVRNGPFVTDVAASTKVSIGLLAPPLGNRGLVLEEQKRSEFSGVGQTLRLLDLNEPF